MRGTLESDDGHVFYVQHRGIMHAPPPILQRLQQGERDLDPSLYYFRITPTFETGSEKYSSHSNHSNRHNGCCRGSGDGVNHKPGPSGWKHDRADHYQHRIERKAAGAAQGSSSNDLACGSAQKPG